LLTFKPRYLGILLVILLVLVVVAPVPQHTIGTLALHDFAHAPVFGVVAVLLLLWLRERAPSQRLVIQYVSAFMGACALGLMTEIAQIPVGRNASWLDVRSDVLGALAFLALFAMLDRRSDRLAVRFVSALIAVVALTIHSWPLAQTTLAYVQRNESFPVLFDARERYDDFFLAYHEATGDHVPLPPEHARYAGEAALLLQLEQRWSPFLSLLEPGPDWRGYRTLAFDLTNAATLPLELKIGVRDRAYDETKHDGFVRVVTLPPQQRLTVRIPVAEIEREAKLRAIELSQIGSVVLFDEYAQSAREVYVARIWLE